MTSEVGICNLGLVALGASPIESLSEGSANARLCKRLYPEVRDFLLSEHGWSFATKLTALSQLEVPTGYEDFIYFYSYPADCLKARELRDGFTKERYLFDIKDYVNEIDLNVKAVQANISPAYLLHTVKIVSTSIFSSLFIDALSLKLAYRMAYPIARNRNVQASILQQYIISLANAKRDDNSARLPVAPSGSWEEARTSGYSSPWY